MILCAHSDGCAATIGSSSSATRRRSRPSAFAHCGSRAAAAQAPSRFAKSATKALSVLPRCPSAGDGRFICAPWTKTDVRGAGSTYTVPEAWVVQS